MSVQDVLTFLSTASPYMSMIVVLGWVIYRQQKQNEQLQGLVERLAEIEKSYSPPPNEG